MHWSIKTVIAKGYIYHLHKKGKFDNLKDYNVLSSKQISAFQLTMWVVVFCSWPILFLLIQFLIFIYSTSLPAEVFPCCAASISCKEMCVRPRGNICDIPCHLVMCTLQSLVTVCHTKCRNYTDLPGKTLTIASLLF